MGRFVSVTPLGIGQNADKVYSGSFSISNKTDREVLYKVRTSVDSKPNLMVKPNMGLLMPYSKTSVAINIRGESQAHIRITTAIFPRELFHKNEIGIGNFNQAWAFLDTPDVDNDIIKFKINENGQPKFKICLKNGAESSPNVSLKKPCKNNDDLTKLIQSEDVNDLPNMLQAAIDQISELEQIKASQNEEIERLNRANESLKRITGPLTEPNNNEGDFLERRNDLAPIYQSILLASAGIIVLNYLFGMFIPLIYP